MAKKELNMWKKASFYPSLMDIKLPSPSDILVQSFQKTGENFSVILRLQHNDSGDVQKWVEIFSNSTCSTWRKLKTYASHGTKNAFRADYRCHHGSYNKKQKTQDERKSSKNTQCKAVMYVVIKKTSHSRNRKSRSKDILQEDWPTVINLKWHHNHQLLASDALKRRDVAEETKDMFIKLFNEGHSPPSALEAHKNDLRLEHTDEGYAIVSADRAICPDLQWCYRLYYKMFKKERSITKEEDVTDTKNYIEAYNQEVGDICVALKETKMSKLIVAGCTPLMKHIHAHIPQSGECVFMSSGKGVNVHSFRILPLMTNSSTGGLPLGLLITTSKSKETITEGLRLLKTIMPTHAFSRRGPDQGPVTFMADTRLMEIRAIHVAWTKSQIILRPDNLASIVDDAIGVLKDITSRHEKSVPLVKVVETVLREWDAYYKRRLNDFALNRNNYPQPPQPLPVTQDLKPSLLGIDLSKISHIHLHEYSVPSETTPEKFYIVNTELGMCTCPHGQTGGPCKHQSAVVDKYNLLPLKHSGVVPPETITLHVADNWFVRSGGVTDDIPDCTDDGITSDHCSDNASYVDPVLPSVPPVLNFGESKFPPPAPDPTPLQPLPPPSPPPPPSCLVSDEAVTIAKVDLQEVFGKLMLNLDVEPRVFYEPIKTFVDKFTAFKTQDELTTALTTFGNCAKPRKPTRRYARKLNGGAKSAALKLSPPLLQDEMDSVVTPTRQNNS